MDYRRNKQKYEEELYNNNTKKGLSISNQRPLQNKSFIKRKIPDRPLPSPSSSSFPSSPLLHPTSSSSSQINTLTTTTTNNNNNNINLINKKYSNINSNNIGTTVAALAAVLATAPTAAARPNSSKKNLNKEELISKQNNQLLSKSTPILIENEEQRRKQYLNNNYLLPKQQQQSTNNNISPSISFHSSSPITPNYSGIIPLTSSNSSYSLRRSIRNEFDAFKRKSISELSLVLEVLKTATNKTKWDEEISNYNKKDCWGRGGGGGGTTTDDEFYYKATSAIYGERRGREIGEGNCIGQSISAVNSIRKNNNNNLIPPHHHSTGNLETTTTTPFNRKNQRRIALRRKIQWERLSPAAIQRQIVQVQEEKAMLQAPTTPISAAKFVAYVQERRKKRILFKGEFLMVQRSVDLQKATTEIGIRMGDKNQYPDTLPYDYNRVILEHRQGIEDSHYINASYVNSWLRERAYVVTQSVRNKQASNELWRCVWEIGANTIVMLTKIFDFMRVVCLQYWPQTQFQFGEIHVETLDTRTYAHFVIRTFRLRKTGGVGDLNSSKGEAKNNNNEEERIVKHFHFTEWELNSFPYISAFVEVRRRVRQWMEKSPVDAPIIVHCSNGGGRSGAFLAVDANLELLQKTGQLDVYEYSRTLINSRQNLISSVEQYTFIYDVLCEAVLCNVQPMAMHQLKDRSTMYKARKNRELMELQDTHENKLLTMLTAPLRIGDCAGGHRLENRGKNRDVMVVPPDHARPYLQTLHGESKDYTYINAVEVDGFTRKAEFIVTEWPKQQTLDSFWTLVFDHNVHTVICLTNQPNDIKSYPQFVHNKGKKNYGPFTIEIVNYQQYPGLCSYMVKISKRPMEEVVEKRKWLFTRRKSSKEGNSRLRRRPTLSNFLAECEKQRRRDSGPPISHFSQNIKQQEDLMSTSLNDPNFRLQQKYWGKIHRRTPTPSPSPEFENSSDDEDYDDENNISSRNSEEENEEEEEEEEHSFDNESNKINYFNKKREENKNKFEQQINSEKFIRNRRTEYLKQQERERPFSDGALIPEQEILMKISVTDAHRPKRDERGRRLGGEWDKRLERLGNQLIAKLNEKGGGEGVNREEEFNLNKKEEEDEDEEYKNEYQSLPSCSSTAISPTTKKTFSQSTKSRSRKSSKSRKSNKNYSHRGSSKRKRRKGERHFSEPNLGTLERFEKTFMISEIMATGASQQQLEAEVRLCCIIQVKMWPIENKVPLSTTALIEVLKMTRSWRKRAPDRPESRPTIVMSHNGVSRCGIFIAANVLIDQMEMDHEVDVFHAVKLIRLNRPQLIDGPRTRFTGDAKDEYKYLYDLMLHWYMTNPELRSFEPPEVDSLGSEEGSSNESIGESQSLGISHKRSIRSKGRRRSIQRSKSSRASRRTNATNANSFVDSQKTDEQKKKMELVYLN